MAQTLLMWTAFVGIILRLIHSGKVCSGDFLDENADTTGYLTSQGLLLMILFYLWAAIFALSLCIALVCCFLSTS